MMARYWPSLYKSSKRIFHAQSSVSLVVSMRKLEALVDSLTQSPQKPVEIQERLIDLDYLGAGIEDGY